MTPPKPRYWQVWLGVLISAVFLVLAVRNIQWTDVWASWMQARWGLLGLGILTLIAGWGVAAVRWRILLAPAPGLRVRDTFAYICIGFLANTVLPFRLGELARATLLGRRKGLGVGRVLGSIALERTCDLFALLGLVLVLGLAMDIPPAIQTAVPTLAVGGLGMLGGLTFLAFHQDRWHRVMPALDRVMPRHVAARIIGLVESISSGALALRRPRALVAMGGLSVLIWGGAGIATWLWIRAFQFPVPWYGAFFVLIMVNLSSAIPSSPGYVGVYHYAAVLALSIWVPDTSLAMAYAFGSHALNMLANVGLGAWFLSQEGLSLKNLNAETPGKGMEQDRRRES